MKKSLFALAIFIFSLSLFAEELEPLANFGIHTICSSGPRRFEGKKLRTIVQYGELGTPIIYIESIHVEMSYPSLSKVLWREKMDETGGVKNICQGPEGIWNCSLENLRWADSRLNYELKTSNGIYRCIAKVVESEDPRITTECSKSLKP